MLAQLGEVASVKKAVIEVVGTKEQIPLQFNPSEYHFSEKVVYENRGTIAKPEYVITRPRTLTLTTYFDTSAIIGTENTSRPAKSVLEKTKKIEELLKVKEEEHLPPKIKISWGDLDFTGWITSASTVFTQFTKEGIAVRAKVDITIDEQQPDKKSMPKASPDRTKTRVLSEDTSIWTIAQNEYGDINEWRRIAKANHILNPFDMEPGQILQVQAIVPED